MNPSPSSKNFINEAVKNGVTAAYSGKAGAMLVNGSETAVKRFLRIQCLKGKGYYSFKFKQGNVS